MVAHKLNPNTEEAEAGRSSLHSQVQASHGYPVRCDLKQQKQIGKE